MRWSFPLGRLFGIPVRVHMTFLLLLVFVYVLYSGYFVEAGGNPQESTKAGLFGVLLTCALFACVVAHELGHSLVARFFGTRTRSIVILPIGGVALLEQIPREAHKEILIALAGPSVSALLAGAFYGTAVIFDCPLAFNPLDLSPGGFVDWLFGINALLIAFNLIPAFPMDGGRVFRGVLSLLVGWEKGTRWASLLGQLVAVFFVLWGFMRAQPGILLIGLFVFFGAGEEGRLAQIRVSLEGATVDQAMVRTFSTLAADQTLLDALIKTVHSNQTDFPVVENGHVLGMASHEKILAGTRVHGLHAPVSQVMTENFPVTSPDDDLEAVFMEVMRRGRATIPVLRDEKLVGIISWEQVNRFGRIRRHLRDAVAVRLTRNPDAEADRS